MLLRRMSRRRINVQELADKLCCHPTTVKRKIKNPPPGFPMPVMLMGKYTWDEGEADAYVEALITQSRALRESAYKRKAAAPGCRSKRLKSIPTMTT
jgi:predicted DNA-binding transcriptional regulator AlpA